jgi:hypothetical protein
MAIDLSKFVYQTTSMDWGTWQGAFLPQPNHLKIDAKFAGRFFEHEGEQWDFIVGQHAQQLWTMVEEEDGTTVLRNGVYVKGRRGYFFCERWHNPRELFKIPVPPRLLEEEFDVR